MKKIIVSLIAVLAFVASASAMGLKEAFNALSNLPNVSVTKPDYNLPVINDAIHNATIAAGYNLDQRQIFESGTAAYTILNQVPLAYMINGANNNEVTAFIYTTPNNEGNYDILIAAMSGYKGSVVFIYGTVDEVSKNAIQNATLEMQGSYLSIKADPIPNIGDFNIILNKGR